MAEITPFPLVEIAGPPRERGVCTVRKQRGVSGSLPASTRSKLHGLGFDDANIERLVGLFLPRIRDWAPDLVLEMEGIAEGRASASRQSC